MLSAVGGLAGCALAFVCTPVILSLIGDSVPRAADAGVDPRVLSFAVFVSFAAGLIFGIVPAIAASKTDLVSTFEGGWQKRNHGPRLAAGPLIVGEVALGLVLTAGAGLLITSFAHLTHSNQGFNPDHLITLFFETPDAHYKDTRAPFYREYFEKVRSLPGVQAAGGSMIIPMTSDGIVISFEDPEHPVPESQHPSADLTLISPDYFRTMQIPLLEGRDFF